MPSFPWKPIFRALDPWLCPFSTPSHSCLKRHENAHNEHNATLSTLTTLHWCFIIQVKKMKSCHILFFSKLSPFLTRYCEHSCTLKQCKLKVRSSAQLPTLVFYQLDTPPSPPTPFSVEHHSYQLVLTLPTECWVPKAQLALAVILKRLAVNNSLVKQDLKDWCKRQVVNDYLFKKYLKDWYVWPMPPPTTMTTTTSLPSSPVDHNRLGRACLCPPPWNLRLSREPHSVT